MLYIENLSKYQLMDKKEKFAEWLQQQLALRGWDQAELARRSTITNAHISRLIGGEATVGPAACLKIARALHLPPEEVFRAAGLLPPSLPAPTGTDELIYYFSTFGEEDRERLLGVARVLHEIGTKGTPKDSDRP